ncbi:MAG: hypothetical protein JWN61_1944 [Pseudonocardiales bacterium]|nr:hypothetical protein [Jatrophihabitantaceae bacterium]MCW2603809.1 hypothetical protein [Pseudonocardiales bacterium]
MTDQPSLVLQPATSRPGTARVVARWMASSAAYPIGGYVALLLAGPVDSAGAALAGGLVTGAIVGAGQVWALGQARARPLAWISATAAGLMCGLAAGAASVGYQTDPRSLALQGAVTGGVLGLAQAALLLHRVGWPAIGWPLWLAAVYAGGWAATTAAGIDVDQQFTIFGASGAVVAAALTSILPLLLLRR